MSAFTISRQVAAPPERVFAVATDLESATEHFRGITKIEKLTEGPTGVGTRFRETRRMFKKEHSEVMEYTVFEPGRRFVLASDSCGVHYASEFRFVPEQGGTRVELEMSIQPSGFVAKLLRPLAKLMMGPMKKCIGEDLEDLRRSAESKEPKHAVVL